MMNRDVTSKSYLGQTFSDSASSPDSLTSEPISFIARAATTSSTAPPSTKDDAHHHQSAPMGRMTNDQSKGNSLPVKQKNVKGSGRSTSPKNIPGAKKTSKKDVGRSVSPVKQRSHLSQKQFSHSYASGQELLKGRLHHAASFDQGRGYPVNRENSPTNSQSSSPYKSGTGSQKGGAKPQKVVAQKQQKHIPFGVYETLVTQVWEEKNDQTEKHQVQSPSKEHGNRIVKKLFSSEERDIQPSAATTTMSVTLQSIFSQANASSVSYSGPQIGLPHQSMAKRPLPLEAVSLDEIEKQIVAEVPSPEVVNPPMGFNVQTQVGENILLQPSVFTSTVSGIQMGVKNTESTSSGSHKATSNGEGMISLTVEPPSPVVAQSQNLASSLGSVLLQPQAFPSIPPVIHSPGMRAPPISSSIPKGGEPSSLATVRRHPVATVHKHQQVNHVHPSHKNESAGMPYRALSEPVLSGMTSVTSQHNPTVSSVAVRTHLHTYMMYVYSTTCVQLCITYFVWWCALTTTCFFQYS